MKGHPTYEIHVHPESRHWFTHVERAGNSYVAELGYYSALGKWTRISTSSGTMTPPDAVSSETDAEFATIPFEFPFAKLLELIKAAVCENLPLAQALEELRRQRLSRSAAHHGLGSGAAARKAGRRSRSRRSPKSSTLIPCAASGWARSKSPN